MIRWSSVVFYNVTSAKLDLIKKGFMAGSVLQNPSDLADAIYTIGMNLFLGNIPLLGTNYKLDETGNIILIPYQEHKTKAEVQ